LRNEREREREGERAIGKIRSIKPTLPKGQSC
jgi:hypothetical protein